MFSGPFDESIAQRARERGLLDLKLHNIRDYSLDRHRQVDDYPYGGGAGMVLRPEPVFAAVEDVLTQGEPAPVVLLTPQGRLLNQQIVRELAGHARLVLLCGHYEGVDERTRQHLVSDEISIGDYVLTGGELPAMVLVDAVVRCLPGALGSPESAVQESHAAGLLEYPQYTRPAEFRGRAVPEVLLSGDHRRIERWRREQSLRRTFERRPDLLAGVALSPAERSLLACWRELEERRKSQNNTGPVPRMEER